MGALGLKSNYCIPELWAFSFTPELYQCIAGFIHAGNKRQAVLEEKEAAQILI